MGVFIALFIYLGLANPWGNKLSHPFPHSYLASDAFYHQSVAQNTKEVGRYWFTPPYEVGGHEDVIDRHPPLLFEVTAAFSYISGLEVYDSILIITVLSCLLFALVFYIISRNAHKYVAMLSLPIMLLVFKAPFNVWLFWGYWMFTIGVLFMISALWSLIRINLEYFYIIIGLFLAGAALSHQPEFIFAIGYIVIFSIAHIIKDKGININYIKKITLAGIIGIPLSLFNLIIFSKTSLLSEGYRNEWDLKNVAAISGLPEMPLMSLGIAGIVSTVGIILFLVSSKKMTLIPAAISLFSFLLGYLILLGIGKRSYTHRFFWYIYISFFFGLALYQVLVLIKKSKLIYAAGITFILLFVFSQPLFSQTKIGSGVMDPLNWEGLKWVSKNTPQNSYVYYFFSNALAHNAPLYSSKRVSFNINTKEYIAALQSGKIQRAYSFGLADSLPDYLCKISRFSFGYYRNHLKPGNDSSYKCENGYKPLEPAPKEHTLKDICNIEYYYFNSESNPAALAQYNMAIRNFLLKNDWIEEVYNNGFVSVLKNNKPGVDCFGNSTG